jgi:uncharacterized protein (TIGR00106 family)
MLAQFSIWPLDDPHLGDDMIEVTEVLEKMKISYQVGPMGTSIQGEWNNVMSAVQACHEAVRASHRRVLTSITIDDDPTRPQSLEEAVIKANALEQKSH